MALSNFLSLHLLTLHALVMTLAALTFIFVSHAMPQRRHPTAAIAWMLFIILLPYAALPAFLVFGTRKLPMRAVSTAGAPAAPTARTARPSGDWVADTLAALGQREALPYAGLSVHTDGQESRLRLFEMLQGATHSIDICTFMLRRDELGMAVLDTLRTKARSGVRVRLLLDRFGDLMAGHPDLRDLKEAGGSISWAGPPMLSILNPGLNLRDHRKAVITDARTPLATLWCGGRNLSGEYFDGSSGERPWIDLTFDLRGPFVSRVSDMFDQDWAYASGRAPHHAPEGAGVERKSAGAVAGAHLVCSGPDQQDDSIYALLLSGFYQARRRIALSTPYFVPDSAMVAALCLAAKRGVSVDLLMPRKSNHRLSDMVRSRSLYTMCEAGCRVWFVPHMLHAKLVIVDDDLALAGSANLDSRSLFLNYEMMVAFRSPADVGTFSAWFEVHRHGAAQYRERRPGLVKDFLQGLLLWSTFQL